MILAPGIRRRVDRELAWVELIIPPQVVPVLPFSLRERSGVPEDQGERPFIIPLSVLMASKYNGGTRSFSQSSVLRSSLGLVSPWTTNYRTTTDN